MIEQSESNDLGKLDISKIFNKDESKAISKGLESLFQPSTFVAHEDERPKITKTKTIETIKTEVLNLDPNSLKQFISVVQDKNQVLESRFDLLESQIEQIGAKKPRVIFDNRSLIGVLSICLLLGALIGVTLTTTGEVEKSPVVAEQLTPKVELPKVVVPKVVVPKKNMMITRKFVNLRDGNSPRAKKIMTIDPAQEVEVLGRKGGWIEVNYHNKLTGLKERGYLWEEYITQIKN